VCGCCLTDGNAIPLEPAAKVSSQLELSPDGLPGKALSAQLVGVDCDVAAEGAVFHSLYRADVSKKPVHSSSLFFPQHLSTEVLEKSRGQMNDYDFGFKEADPSVFPAC
jgi:hypothetical protein